MDRNFSNWIQNLLNEGYDLSDYTWDEMYEVYEETDQERKKRLAKRHARVKEMTERGQVMTPAKRAAARRAEKERAALEDKLERKGNEVIRVLQGRPAIRSEHPMGSVQPEPKPPVPTGGNIKVIPSKGQGNDSRRSRSTRPSLEDLINSIQNS